MRRYISIIAIVAIAIIASACDDSSGTHKFGAPAWSQSLSENDEALERSIIADIMGGIAADLIVPEEMSLTGLDLIDDPNKLSISAPLERSYTNVADSYVYESESGAGTLTITVDGDAEELNVQSETKRKLRFFPIEVVFAFSNYDYTNSCGLPAVISGTINCRLQGTVNRTSDILEGVGSCSSGPEGMTGTLLYSLSEEEYHDVFIHANIRVDGPWYELTSYQIYGSYMLDRRTGSIDSVIARAPTMCEY